jgi:hypothetical protein
MDGVFELAEKNYGDVRGDMSFVLGNRVHQFQCRQHPQSIQCQNLAQFNGDTPNNTDIVLEVQVTMDGKFGPYLYCNPTNVSNPRGRWQCDAGLNFSNPAVPYTCNKDYVVFGDTTFNFDSSPTVAAGANTVTECCGAMTEKKQDVWSFYTGNSTCVYSNAVNQTNPIVSMDGSYSAYSSKLIPKPCDCARVHKTVGRENLTVVFTGENAAQYPVGGEWFSAPANGECVPPHTVGDGSGCTWSGKVTKAVNASCMYQMIDAAVEQMAPKCFQNCPQPKNKTSNCYLGCFANVTLTAPKTELVKPWLAAFAGDCPPFLLP